MKHRRPEAHIVIDIVKKYQPIKINDLVDKILAVTDEEFLPVSIRSTIIALICGCELEWGDDYMLRIHLGEDK